MHFQGEYYEQDRYSSFGNPGHVRLVRDVWSWPLHRI
jgi:hypothetical protein